MDTEHIDPDRLESFASSLVAALGAPEDHAAQVASSLVAADLRGHGSHGVIRLGLYAAMVEDGAIDPAAAPTTAAETETTAIVDGHSTFGQVVGRRAVEAVVERAAARGVAAVGVRNAAHLGRIGEWAERATEAGVVLCAFVNLQGGGPLVAPAGSADRRLATNPISVGVPTFGGLEFPLVLDMATSQVAHGKISRHEATGDPLPDAWTATADGDPVTDPAVFNQGEGALLPLGGREAGYKGFGLAVAAELLAGLLGDTLVAGQFDGRWFDNAAALLAVDPLAFTTEEAVAERVTDLARHLRSADPAPGIPVGHGGRGDEALLPGEAEHRTLAERRAAGVPLPERVRGSLADLADEHGVDPL